MITRDSARDFPMRKADRQQLADLLTLLVGKTPIQATFLAPHAPELEHSMGGRFTYSN
ncbi:hypothetical protein Poly24_54880 [Rosistilla carotiformis]|uniref:Uncharacterized protein n=1 Tax=Rosistilla carotiformis TaxID=2528017 RepID=A0A518K1Q3_9BACT|nr:hypothetical protein Poly24_54880 [Rosistilla carotiformis]